MRSLIRLFIVLVVCLAGIGLYRGWFSLSKPNPDGTGDKVNINVSVDEGKMKSDVKMAEEKVKEEIKVLEDKVQSKEGAK